MNASPLISERDINVKIEERTIEQIIDDEVFIPPCQ